jgi:hypothetical protein
MNLRAVLNARAMRAAVTALVVALALVLWTLTRALRSEPLPDTPPTIVAILEAIGKHSTPAPADIQTAVDKDLFAADRSAPDAPYRMPGESDGKEKSTVEPMKPVVLGTAVATDGRSFATLQLGDASPALVRVGDKIGEWVVKAIERGKIVLVSTSGTRADLTVPKPGT